MSKRDLTTTEFRTWLQSMGLSRSATSVGAGLIGITGRTRASETATGKRDLTLTERLAMSAVRAGLSPWQPEYETELAERFGEPPAISRDSTAA